MPPKPTLDPDDRALYGKSLQPPAGYQFDAGVANTFSLDFETALAVPVSLALFAAENRHDILSHPLALLEGAERMAGRLLVFSDAGRIHASPQARSRLCSLLERMIVEVAAPGGGAFHPKLWAIRFRPIVAGDPVRLRLLVLSRNLTRDRSWDTILTLDGMVKSGPRKRNRPIAELVRRLPEMATAGVPEGAQDLVDGLAEDLRHADWTLPEGFEEIEFAVNGLGGAQWRPQRAARLGVMSPFCDEATLSAIAGLPTAEKPVFIGRPDELAAIGRETLEGFSHVAVLDEVAALEDGEEADASALHGLHAKVFIAERGWNTAVTVGSGNATRPALEGRNVEVFATLTGKRSRVGGVEDMLGQKGFGRLTRPFEPGEIACVDASLRAAEMRLEEARRELCRRGMILRCEREPAGEDQGATWRVWLVPPGGLALSGVGALRVWPITRGEGHARDALDDLRKGLPVDLGAMPLIDLTRFLAIRIEHGEQDLHMLFSTGLQIEGLPTERSAAILRWVIDGREIFLRYLRLLLLEMGDVFGAALAAQDGTAGAGWRSGADDDPLFENLVRAFCQGGDRLRAIDRLMTRLEAEPSDQADPVPAEFRALWSTFRAAISSQENTVAK